MARFFILLSLATTALSLAQTGGKGGNSECAQWCAANFPNPGEVCTAPAAHGTGPCYVCGPLKTSPTQQLCGGECKETSTDNSNCGACGNICPSGFECQAGVCKRQYPPSTCDNVEVCGYTPCGAGGNFCICQPDERGIGYCNVPQSCSDLTPCATIDDCPVIGSVCLSTCCPGGGVCFTPPQLCPNPGTPTRLFRVRGDSGPMSGLLTPPA